MSAAQTIRQPPARGTTEKAAGRRPIGPITTYFLRREGARAGRLGTITVERGVVAGPGISRLLARAERELTLVWRRCADDVATIRKAADEAFGLGGELRDEQDYLTDELATANEATTPGALVGGTAGRNTAWDTPQPGAASATTRTNRLARAAGLRRSLTRARIEHHEHQAQLDERRAHTRRVERLNADLASLPGRHESAHVDHVRAWAAIDEASKAAQLDAHALQHDMHSRMTVYLGAAAEAIGAAGESADARALLTVKLPTLSTEAEAIYRRTAERRDFPALRSDDDQGGSL